MRHSWTKERVAAVNRMLESGVSPQEVASAYGVIVNAIHSAREAAKRRGLRIRKIRNRKTGTDAQAIAKLVDLGVEHENIGARFGISRSAVSGYVHRLRAKDVVVNVTKRQRRNNMG